MAINKIIVDGVTKIDLTQDTATADKVLEGYTFHDATGTLLTGTMKAGADVGDFTLYTKYIYNYDDYTNNNSSVPNVTVYDEDWNAISCYYMLIRNNEIQEMFNYVPSLYNSTDVVYAVAIKKIGSVDLNFGGACGC